MSLPFDNSRRQDSLSLFLTGLLIISWSKKSSNVEVEKNTFSTDSHQIFTKARFVPVELTINLVILEEYILLA